MIAAWGLRLAALGCLAMFLAALYWHSQAGLVASALLAVSLGVMALRALRRAAKRDEPERLRAAAAPHLEPGEVIQAAFAAIGGPGPYLGTIVVVVSMAVSALIGRQNATRMLALLALTTTRSVVVASDRAILLLQRPPALKTAILIARLPRHTRLGPVSGWWAMISLHANWMFVHHRFHSEIALADRLATPAEIAEPWDGRVPRSRTRHPLSLRSRGPRRRS